MSDRRLPSPLAFEANEDGASFRARGSGYAVTLTNSQAVVGPLATSASGSERRRCA